MAGPWTNDYYAAIVALAGITIVAKFVTHRSNGQSKPVKPQHGQQELAPRAGQPASDPKRAHESQQRSNTNDQAATKRTRRTFTHYTHGMRSAQLYRDWSLSIWACNRQ